MLSNRFKGKLMQNMKTPGYDGKIRKFVSRNLVTIVMVPSLIGIHYGWMALQDNETLVPEHVKTDLPPVMFIKYLWKQAQTKMASAEYTNRKPSDK